MKQLKIILILASLGMPLANSFGQHNFYKKVIDLKDTINSKFFHAETDKLGMMLVDAYLQGKLKGYKFDVGNEVMKRAPLPKQDYPTWKAGTTYYAEDIVSYKNNLYVLMAIEFIDSMTPPSQDKRWEKYEVLGEPISFRNFFPTLKDTLSKAALLKNMISQMPIAYLPWNPNEYFYAGDVVWYDGRNYEAVRDSNGKTPTDREYWELTSQGSMQFHSFTDLTGFYILYYSKSPPAKAQMISLLFNTYGVLQPLGLNFYAQDVFNYLTEIDQPVLYKSSIGYVGMPQLVLGHEERIEFVKLMKSSLKENKIKLRNDQILDAKLRQQFLDADEEQVVTNWAVMQDLITNDFWISLRKFDDETGIVIATTPSIKISFKQLQKLIVNLKGYPKTYREAIEKNEFNFRDDTLTIDSLEFMSPAFAPAKPAKGYYFYESYLATMSANSQLQNQVPGLWKRIEELFYAQKLLARNQFSSLYPCTYDWSHVNLGPKTAPVSFDKNFTLGVSITNPIDSLLAPQQFTEVGITYKKFVSDGKSKALFEPVQFAVSFIPKQVSDEPVWPVTYTFQWQDLSKIFESSNEFIFLFNQIKAGMLTFHDSRVVYGLTAAIK